MSNKSTINYSKVKKVAEQHSTKAILKPYEDAQKVIDRYYAATGRNKKVRYVAVAGNQPRKLTNYAGPTSAI